MRRLKDTCTCDQTSLFNSVRKENGIIMADGVVDLKDEHCMVLVAQNYGPTPVKLKKVCILDATELGTTDVASHTINTGDHTPLKQPLRRTPFEL